MAIRIRVTVRLKNGLARDISPKRATELEASGRIVRAGEHFDEAYPFALEQFFRVASMSERELARGDNKGWDIVASGGIPVWQMVEGGAFQPL